MTITIHCKEIEVDCDNDLQNILTNDAYCQEIVNHTFYSVEVTDDEGKQVFYSKDINDFTVEEGEDISFLDYDYAEFQQCDDYLIKEIEGEFDPKHLIITKYKLILPDYEFEGCWFDYTIDPEDEWEEGFEHGESGMDCDYFYKKIDGKLVGFDPEDEEEEED